MGEAEPRTRLYVPVPPSTNNLFVAADGRASGRTRAKSKKYREWLHDAGWRVRLQRPPHFAEPVRVLIEVDVDRRSDLDNRIKALLDLLVFVQVLEDDNLVDDLRIVRRGERQEAAISIWPMEE